MVGHGGSSAGSYLADPTSPIPSHCASIVVTSTLRVNRYWAMWAYHTVALFGTFAYSQKWPFEIQSKLWVRPYIIYIAVNFRRVYIRRGARSLTGAGAKKHDYMVHISQK